MVTCVRLFLVFCVLQILSAVGGNVSSLTEKSRQKRGAVFTPATVLQFSIALAYPIEIPNRKAATNLGVLLNIDLPFNITQLYPYRPEAEGRALSHNALYDNFEHILDAHGYNGQECILKSICQIARKKIDDDDLSHSFLQLFFRPTFLEGCQDEKCGLIKEARVAGILNVDCNSKYSMCSSSILDLISS